MPEIRVNPISVTSFQNRIFCSYPPPAKQLTEITSSSTTENFQSPLLHSTEDKSPNTATRPLPPRVDSLLLGIPAIYQLCEHPGAFDYVHHRIDGTSNLSTISKETLNNPNPDASPKFTHADPGLTPGALPVHSTIEQNPFLSKTSPVDYYLPRFSDDDLAYGAEIESPCPAQRAFPRPKTSRGLLYQLPGSNEWGSGASPFLLHHDTSINVSSQPDRPLSPKLSGIGPEMSFDIGAKKHIHQVIGSSGACGSGYTYPNFSKPICRPASPLSSIPDTVYPDISSPTLDSNHSITPRANIGFINSSSKSTIEDDGYTSPMSRSTDRPLVGKVIAVKASKRFRTLRRRLLRWIKKKAT